MGRYSRRGITFLGRLLADRAGNTLAIAAAALLPMMALIGGGVDVSRAYMAKTQLQSACDSGVLAGRRAMSKTGTYGTTEKAKAKKMFDFNFNKASVNATGVTYVTHDNTDGQVLGTATATVPTLVMKIFKMDTVDLSVDCMAELQIGNADVMFVLDNTTSMKCAPEDTKTNCTQYAITDSHSKFYGLVQAVKDFHITINSSVNDTRTRIRYGFVPYAMTVNVAGLLTDSVTPMPTSDIADSTSYQTRVAQFNTAVVGSPYNPNTPTNASTTETYGGSTPTAITQANCGNSAGTGSNYGNNKYPSGSSGTPINGGGPSPTATTVTTYVYLSWLKTGTQGSGSNKVDIGTCKRTKNVATTTYTGTTWYQFTRWIYQPDALDTSGFKGMTSTTYASGITVVNGTPDSSSRTKTSGTWDMVELAKKVADGSAKSITTSTSTWNGCIEERKTETPSGSYDFDPIPDAAYDLDFDLEPDTNDPDTLWKPQWNALYYERSGQANASFYIKPSTGSYYSNSGFTGNAVTPTTSTPGVYCPAQMRLLDTKYATLSTDKTAIPAALSTFLGTLKDSGYTYHDVGMIWGGRLTSPTGIFAENVNKDADKISVSKHIIFMTDGILQPEPGEYSAYGEENYDHRIAPAGSEGDIYNRHMARFVAMCEAIKAQGTTIWVVAFGTTMTTQLQNCASGGRAYYSSNTTALRNTFKFIAAQVADLRLGA